MHLPPHLHTIGVVLATLSATAFAAPVPAQEPDVKVAAGFDPSRASMPDEPQFQPFYVEETVALREALDRGRVDGETALLVTEVEGERLGLVLDQMAYHHIAQGELAGEPWMVSF